MSLILGIITALFQAIGSTFWKKALDNSNLSSGLFLLFGPLSGIIFIYSAIFLFNISLGVFGNLFILFLLILAAIFDSLGQRVEAKILKIEKMSFILPYRNFDKIFIILLGFILYFGQEGYTSIPTLIISIFTFFIIMFFSLDLKHIKFDKNILIYISGKFFTSVSTLIVGYVLLTYTTLELFAAFVIFIALFHITVNYFLGNDFKQMLKQNKQFYKYRALGSLLGWGGFFLSFLIIESSGVVIASLISFVGIVFTIFSMKFVLGDNPNRKQIILAFLVTLLIGIGFYFK